MMGEKNLLFDLANELVKKTYKVTLDFPFLNISYSSLKETKYLIYFSYECGILKETEHLDILKNANRLAAILYGLLYKK